MAKQAMILWDPRGELLLGEMVEESLTGSLKSRGVASIPVDPLLVQRNALSGVFYKAYGRGLALPGVMPLRVTAMMLYVLQQGGERIALRARLNATNPEDPKLSGMLRLIQDTGQVGGNAFGISGDAVVHLDSLGPPDKHGGWTIETEARLGGKVDSYQALALYGAGVGATVAWVAVSQI